MRDPLLLDATAQLQMLHGGHISAVELLEAHLARANKLKRLGAAPRRDEEGARARARDFDTRRAALIASGGDPRELHPLDGLPMTVKDVFDVDGMPASAGLKALTAAAAGDADVVGRVRSAGANVWGKTAVPVMAADWQSYSRDYGVAANPWDAERTPGGSSGGAAAALAVGITPLEIGSDIGGSIRVPSAFCGVFGHKPTFGLVSQRGHVPPRRGWAAERDLNVIGPMARSARDLRLLLSILSSAPVAAKAPSADLVGLKVGLWAEEPAMPLDPQVKAAVMRFAGQLAQEGAAVEPVSSPVHAQSLLEVNEVLLMSGLSQDFPESQQRILRRQRLRTDLTRGLGWGLGMLRNLRAMTATHAEWLKADNERQKMKEAAALLFGLYDVILAPAAPVTAFPHDHRPFAGRTLAFSDGARHPYGVLGRWIALATTLGLPATTVPVGKAADGLPVGVQIIAAEGMDSKALAVAQAVEDRICGFEPPPILAEAP